MRIDSSRTFGGLLLDLAIRLGVATTSSTAELGQVLPTDAAQLGILKDALWAGARNVAKESAWSWLHKYETITLDPDGLAAVCVDGDPRRYNMPAGITSGPLGRVSWSSGSSGGFVTDTSPERVDRQIATFPEAVGRPSLVSVWPDVGGEGNQRDRYVLTVYPAPDQAYTLKAKYRRAFDPPKELSERPMWSEEVDEVVLAAALVHLKRLDKMKSGVLLESLVADYLSKLQDAIKHDNRLRGKVLGVLGDSISMTPTFPGVVNQQGTVVVQPG